ncbi:hypothetical protein TYRP_021985 [Tyrophagus putrescentiae]|nr:hypothetical protein TYRP_021985 [Tyrophagus putrescentiae]
MLISGAPNVSETERQREKGYGHGRQSADCFIDVSWSAVAGNNVNINHLIVVLSIVASAIVITPVGATETLAEEATTTTAPASLQKPLPFPLCLVPFGIT